MSLIADVVDVVQAPHLTGLLGCHLERPLIGRQPETGAVSVSGWALGDRSPVVAVEIDHDGATVARSASLSGRPDIAEAFPGNLGADRSEFALTVAGLWGETVDLQVSAVLADQSRCQVGTIKVRAGSQSEMRPLVSVVIPCYGQSHFLADAIASVLSQTHANVEMVVVDDGSRDNVAAVVARYPGVRRVQQDNRGLSAARNAGIRESVGEFLVLLDADDMLLPTSLQVGVDRFEHHPQSRMVTGRYRYVDWDGHPQPTPEQQLVSEDHYGALLRCNFAGNTGTAMYRRLVFDEVGGFDEAFGGAADYELSLRIVRDYPVHCHDVEVLAYRRGTQHMSNDSRLMFEETLRAVKLQRRRAFERGDLRAAYADGLEFWRGYYRPGVIDQIDASLVGRDLGGAMRGMMTLVRHDRRGLPELVRRNRERRAQQRLTK